MKIISKKDLEQAYARFLRNIGGEDGTDVGEYMLDFNAAYGGYMVVLHGPMGSVSEPFGAIRRNRNDMASALYFASAALELVRDRRRVMLKVAVQKVTEELENALGT